MKDERGPWYLLTGLVIGVGLGLLIAWVLSPVEHIEISPSALAETDKDQYRAMIALAYSANGDLTRARARLELIDEDPVRELSDQVQRSLTTGGSSREAQALSLLAMALDQ